jgi:hypothetical protein
MSHNGDQQNPVDRMSKAKKAYEFFALHERAASSFSLEELQQATGYREGTIDSYVSKKWRQFLTVDAEGKYLCQGIVRCPLEKFLELHEQARVVDLVSLPADPSSENTSEEQHLVETHPSPTSRSTLTRQEMLRGLPFVVGSVVSMLLLSVRLLVALVKKVGGS